MSYFLEQGVYFLSNPAFETTFGLGLQASSLKDRESVQAMRTVAASLDFYSERTEYSFIYNSTLGFALAATTTRMPAGESRRTPYIHLMFPVWWAGRRWRRCRRGRCKAFLGNSLPG